MVAFAVCTGLIASTAARIPSFLAGIIAVVARLRKLLTGNENWGTPAPVFKRLTKSGLAAGAAAFLVGAYIRMIRATSRRRIVGKEHLDEAAAAGKGVILAFWHGRMLLAPTVRDLIDGRFFMLISVHRDGEIIARAVKSFGVEFIRGSAANPKKPDRDKGGASATAQMIAVLRDGHVVGVTPDGPRGPCEKAQAGVIRLAQLSGAPILPVGFSSSRGRRLETWDRFLLSRPFSRCAGVAGPAIWLSPENDPAAVESARRRVENALQTVTQLADRIAGRRDGRKRESS